MQPARLAVLGHQRDSQRKGVARRVDDHRLAVDRDLAAAPAARGAEDGFEDLGAAGPEQPADSQDLAAPKIEVHAM